MLRLILALSVVALLSTRHGECAKILGVFPLNGHSHWTPSKMLLEELARRGHEITVVGHFPRKTPLPNYKDISLDGVLPQFVNNMSYDLVSRMDLVGATVMVWTMAGVDICEKLYTTPQFTELIKSKEKYDLIITETFGSECSLGFVAKFRVPWISVACALPMDWQARQVDVPIIPSVSNNIMLPFPGRMNFWERTKNILYHIVTHFGFHYLSRVPSQRVVCEAFAAAEEDCPDLSALSRSASLLLSNSHFSLTGARPGVPGHVEVGGIHITKEPAPLPKDIQKLLDDATRGVVYFSFGSMVQSETIPQGSLQTMLDAFGRLPQGMTVLWKADPKRFPADLVIPKNVVTRPWLPQRDVLAHKNIKVFVTHGGLLGTMEAVHCGVPMLGVPLFGDQLLNIKIYVRKGIARLVAVPDIVGSFEKSLRDLLDDKGFKQNALKVSAQFRDRPATPLDTAVFWTEYVLRHGGAQQLRTPAKHLHWAQICMLDVFAMLAGVGLLALVFVWLGCAMLCRCCRRSTTGGESRTESKKVKKN